MTLVAVTYMVMTAPPPGAARNAPRPGLEVRRERPEPQIYVDLFRAIGEPQGWDGRTTLSDSEIRELLADPSTGLWLLRDRGEPAGFAEFAGLNGPEVELLFFGIAGHLRGQGIGRWFLDIVLRRVWLAAPDHVWLHTDAMDDPAAIPTYRSLGFQVEAVREEDAGEIGLLPPPWKKA